MICVLRIKSSLYCVIYKNVLRSEKLIFCNRLSTRNAHNDISRGRLTCLTRYSCFDRDVASYASNLLNFVYSGDRGAVRKRILRIFRFNLATRSESQDEVNDRQGGGT